MNEIIFVVEEAARRRAVSPFPGRVHSYAGHHG
jgi:hypothetical protein